jgi:hypothetical protein
VREVFDFVKRNYPERSGGGRPQAGKGVQGKGRPSRSPLSTADLAQNDIATATATVKNNLPKVANIVMVDLGIPPGFDLLSENLAAYQEKSAGQKSGRLEKFSLTSTQAILYFDSIAPGDAVTLRFRFRAKYPIRARPSLPCAPIATRRMRSRGPCDPTKHRQGLADTD